MICHSANEGPEPAEINISPIASSQRSFINGFRTYVSALQIPTFSDMSKRFASLLSIPSKEEINACWDLCRLNNHMGCWTTWLPTCKSRLRYPSASYNRLLFMFSLGTCDGVSRSASNSRDPGSALGCKVPRTMFWSQIAGTLRRESMPVRQDHSMLTR